jgi:hypothetical protein
MLLRINEEQEGRKEKEGQNLNMNRLCLGGVDILYVPCVKNTL